MEVERSVSDLLPQRPPTRGPQQWGWHAVTPFHTASRSKWKAKISFQPPSLLFCVLRLKGRSYVESVCLLVAFFPLIWLQLTLVTPWWKLWEKCTFQEPLYATEMYCLRNSAMRLGGLTDVWRIKFGFNYLFQFELHLRNKNDNTL